MSKHKEHKTEPESQDEGLKQQGSPEFTPEEDTLKHTGSAMYDPGADSSHSNEQNRENAAQQQDPKHRIGQYTGTGEPPRMMK